MGSMLVHDSNACRSLMCESEVLEVHEGMLLSVSSDWYSHNSSISLFYIQCIQLREQINGIFYCLSLFFTGGEIWELQILFFVYLYINAILTHDMFHNCGIVVNVEVILG